MFVTFCTLVAKISIKNIQKYAGTTITLLRAWVYSIHLASVLTTSIRAFQIKLLEK